MGAADPGAHRHLISYCPHGQIPRFCQAAQTFAHPQVQSWGVYSLGHLPGLE